VSPVKYELGFYIPEDDILHSHRRDNVNSYKLNLNGEQYFYWHWYVIRLGILVVPGSAVTTA
jgi:hypothetical protein